MSAFAKNYGYFFNSNSGDRTYNAESFEEWLKPFFLSGVFNGELQVLAQTTPDMTVKVTAGHANLDGKAATWDSENTMQLSVASGVYDRIDTIVLRRDNVNRTISIEVVTGTASADPQPTAPTRTANIFELVLAQILVGTGVTAITQANITDTRMDSTICGYVAATVDQIDFDQIYAQYEAWQADTQDYFTNWFEAIRGQLDEDAAGHLQNEVDDLRSAIAFMQNGAIATRNYDEGDYLYITNHPQIADGLYTTASDISSGAVIGSPSVLTVYAGGFNLLNDNLTAAYAAAGAAMAIISVGNTHVAISKGEYVYVTKNNYAPDGLYIANANIAENGDISGKVDPVDKGGFNELNGNLTPVSVTPTAASGVTLNDYNIFTIGKIACVNVSIAIGSSDIGSTNNLVTGLPIPKAAFSVAGNRTAGGGNSQAILSTSGVLRNNWDTFASGKTYIFNICYATA